jgi:outer membrane protein assembly factor BamE (lipoprotein component of BamABCDE complex)
MALQLKRIHKIGLFFLAVLVISWSLLKLFEVPFDKANWKTNPTERYEMVDDLIESQLLMGKTKVEVITLLGKPYSSSTTENDIFIYKLGDQPSFFKSRKEHLLIIFINQKVNEVTLALE